jgi:hypothetical protein
LVTGTLTGGTLAGGGGTLSLQGGVQWVTSQPGNLSLDGTLNVMALSGFSSGTYHLYNYTGD